MLAFFFLFLGSQLFDRGCEVPKKCAREKQKKSARLTSFSYFCLSLHFWDAILLFFFSFCVCAYFWCTVGGCRNRVSRRESVATSLSGPQFEALH